MIWFWLTGRVFVSVAELSRRWSDELDGRIDRNADAYTHVSCAHMCVLIFIQYLCVAVRTCIHVETAGVRIHAFSCVCSSKHICLLLLSKTHSHLNAGDRTHLPALWAARQLSQNILEYTHTHARTHTPPWGTPYAAPGECKMELFKSQKTLLPNKLVCLIIPHPCFSLLSHDRPSLSTRGGCFGCFLGKGRGCCFGVWKLCYMTDGK